MTREDRVNEPVNYAAENRKDFLFRMYEQMFNDINTHIVVIWQSVGVLVGAFAVFALVEKQVISMSIGSTLIVLITFWLFAHVVDASYWYNRNLVIIANIERQFLIESDLSEIHYYFGKHRKAGKMIQHLKIQFLLGVGVCGIVLLLHFYKCVLPDVFKPNTIFNFEEALPYILLLASIIYLIVIWNNRKNAYREFIKNSPGKPVDTTGIDYRVGHPPEG